MCFAGARGGLSSQETWHIYFSPSPGGDGNQQKHPTNAYLVAQVCSVVLTLGHISDFNRHVPDLVTLVVQWGRWPAKRKIQKCKGTISSGDVVKVTGEPVKDGDWKELAFKPETSGVKRSLQDPNG